MGDERPDRKVININRAEYRVYDMEGPVQPDMGWLPLSYNDDGNGCYAIRMEPGAETIAHTHEGVEDYLILEGELIESDGRVLKRGDFVHYDPGSHHNSRTETGCLLIGFDWGKPSKG
jgi:anti-sigma factor ChrR (cupin superfamily)